MIYAADSDPSDKLFDLVLSAAKIARSTSMFQDVRMEFGGENVYGVYPGEHYRLLPALVDVWNAEFVVEIGTYQGASAIAIAESRMKPRVISFDVIPWQQIPGSLSQGPFVNEKFRQIVADVTSDRAYLETLNSADLLFIDGPKDGFFEKRLIQLLESTHPVKEQLLVFDDIRVSTMLEIWMGLTFDKMDITSLGHWSGTGVAIRPTQKE